MTLQELRYFVAVADHRHFGRAAEACCVTQPTLSTQLRKLESYLGMTLIDRSGKQPVPSPVGEQILEHARRLLDEADEILQLGERQARSFEGTLRVGVIPTLAPYYLPWLLPYLARQYPRLQFTMVEETTRGLEEKLVDQVIDAAFLALPALSRPDLIEHALFDEPFFAALPADLVIAGEAGESLDIKQLSGLKLLLLTEGHCLRGQALAVCRQSNTRHDNTADCRATSLETLRYLVIAGLGYTLLPALAALKLSHDGLAIRPLVPGESRRIGLVWRAGHPRSVELRSLAACLGEELLPGVLPVTDSEPLSTIDVMNETRREFQLHT